MTAEEKLEAIFVLLDKASSPADKIEKKLSGLKKAANALKKFDFGGAFGEAFDALEERFPKLAKVASTFGGVAKTVGAAAVGVGVALAAATYKLATFGVESTESKKHLLDSLEVLEGTAEGASEAESKIKGLANAFGKSADPIAAMYKELRGVGFAMDDATRAISAGADIGYLFGDEAGNALVDALKKLKGGDLKLDAKELTPIFKRANVDIKEIYKSLAEAKKTTPEQIEAMMKAGQIKADEGIEAIYATIERKTGKALGGVAALGGDTVTGQIAVLKNLLGDLAEDVNLNPLVGMLKALNKVLSDTSPEGQKLKQALTASLSTLFSSLASVLTPERIAQFVIFLADAVTLTTKFLGVLASGTFQGFMAIFQHAIDVWREFNTGLGDSVDWVKVFKVAGLILGGVLAILAIGIAAVVAGLAITGAIIAAVVVPIYYLAEGVLWVIDKIAQFAAWLTETGNWLTFFAALVLLPFTALMGLGALLWDAGVALVVGFWDGIKSKWGELTQWVSTKANGIVGTVKGALGIASPSKVMMGVGLQTMEGFNLGLEDGAANTNAIVSGAAEDAAAAPASPAGGSAAGGGKSSGGTVINIYVTVPPGTENPEAFGASVAKPIRDEIVGVLEHVADQYAATGSD